MKLMMLSLAGVMTASAMTPVAADAQRWRDERGWHSGRYYHGGRYYARDCQEFCAGGRLPSLDDEALTEDYGELTFGLTPFARWALPFVRRVIEHEI